MAYTKTQWQNFTTPAINQTNLNKIETALYNADQQLNTLASSLNSFKTAGVISPFGGNTIPSGWLLCNGQEVSKTTYAKLYQAIGDIWGTPTSSSNFKLPNLQGKILYGQNTGNTNFATMGQTGGSPAAWYHTHGASQSAHSHQNRYYSSDWSASGSRNTFHRGSYGSYSWTDYRTPAVHVGANGSTSNPTDNMEIANLPPYVVCQYIICTGD